MRYAEVIQALSRFESDPVEARQFLNSLNSVDPELAREYEKRLAFPDEKPEKSTPSPSPTP